jgi:hypothetical protein
LSDIRLEAKVERKPATKVAGLRGRRCDARAAQRSFAPLVRKFLQQSEHICGDARPEPG